MPAKTCPDYDYDGKPGFKDVYSKNPDSADYSPDRFNRCLKVLHDHGVALDIAPAEALSRKLTARWPIWSDDMRNKIIAAIARSPRWDDWLHALSGERVQIAQRREREDGRTRLARDVRRMSRETAG